MSNEREQLIARLRRFAVVLEARGETYDAETCEQAIASLSAPVAERGQPFALYAAPPVEQKADDIHTCSYYCTRPACIRAQRDELRDKMEAQQKEMDRLTASERSAWNAAVQRDEEIERLKAAQQKETPAKQNEWKEAVIEKLIVCHIYQKKHDDDPIGALNDLLSWEIKIALDPQVSSEAQALIDRGWIAAQQKAEPCNCRIGECESKPGKLCRMTVELKTGGQQ